MAPKTPPKHTKRKLTTSKPLTRPSKPKQSRAPNPKDQVKTKRADVASAKKKKQRTYTDKELGIPTLNTITPVGVQKPRGKKKGKVFVDDQESMMTILAMVNADKEGQIESKMMKARQMEEIRDARRKEAEARQAEKSSKLVSFGLLFSKSRKIFVLQLNGIDFPFADPTIYLCTPCSAFSNIREEV